jgi:SAM-dependent methyltransferase
VKPEERWLTEIWPLVRGRLPAPPARVLDLGCGPLGGFVPFLESSGYEAVGVDPRAPDGPGYHRVEFEQLELPERFDAVIASTSLHHVADPAAVIDRLERTLAEEGMLVVVEWAWELFDEATAKWCFQRLAQDGEGWLHRLRDEWKTSGRPWPDVVAGWATGDGMHRGKALVQLLDRAFERRFLAFGPYFFTDLDHTTEVDEQAAIDAGLIRATRIDWVGRVNRPQRRAH